MRGTVGLDPRDATLLRALTYVLQEHHIVHVDPPRATYIVSDFDGRPNISVLMVAPVPAACRDALDAFMHLRVRGLALRDEPDLVPAALGALENGMSLMSRRIVEAANLVPAMTPVRASSCVRSCAARRIAGSLGACSSRKQRSSGRSAP